jgi:hypothetical protein
MSSVATVSVATVATAHSQKDLYVLLNSLNIWATEKITVYILCDSTIFLWLQTITFTQLEIRTKVALNTYKDISRYIMERTPGKYYKSQWGDLMGEKMNLLDWVFQTENNTFLLDSDICFFAPLPSIPEGTQLALSPHEINRASEIRFGKYNGGFLYTSSKTLAAEWRKATHISRYFEQAALEDLATLYKGSSGGLYEFPLQINYGWWRMFQAEDYPDDQKKKFGFFRGTSNNSGILFDGMPLNSTHTHWYEKSDKVTREFNTVILQKLRLCSTKSPKTAELFRMLQKMVDNQ